MTPKPNETIPDRYPAQMTDCTLQSWQELGMGEMLIQMELSFTERLDLVRLDRAYRLLLDAEPVLGCRMVVELPNACWQRLPAGHPAAIVLTATEGDYLCFRDSPIDACEGPQVRIGLWNADDGDRLLIKVAHQAADAGGTKDVAAILADIYTKLGNEPDYQPIPNVAGSRGPDQLLRRLPLSARVSIFFLFLRKTLASMIPYRSQMLPLPDGPCNPWSYVTRHFPLDQTKRMAMYGRERNATLNDLVSAAFYRSLAKCSDWDGRRALRLFTTLDFRRWYLSGERAEAVCNLSGFEWLFIQRRLGRDFDETLARVSALSRKHKAHYPGLADIPMFKIIEKKNYAGIKRFHERLVKWIRSTGTNGVALTNMGAIIPERVTFGATVPRKAYLLVPPIHAPLFGIGMSGYDGALTLTSGVTETTRPMIERFFDAMLEELPK